MNIAHMIIIMGAALLIPPRLRPYLGGRGGYKGNLLDWLVALSTVTITLVCIVLFTFVLEMLIGG